MVKKSMGSYDRIKGNMHWTVQYAMHTKTIQALVPVVAELIRQWDIKSDIPEDILAGQLLYGISATIHSEKFEKLSDKKKKDMILTFVKKIVGK